MIRVSYFSRIIARGIAQEHGLSDEYVEQLFTFAPLHDIGKIAVEDAILCKPAKLTEEEYTRMQTHTIKGREIIISLQENLDLLSPQSCEVLQNIVCHHHESWDGNGYPGKLAGEAIPLEARIITVADVFDALTSRRVYKERWPFEKAVDYMIEKRGVQFDPVCVDKFLENPEELKAIIDNFDEKVDYE